MDLCCDKFEFNSITCTILQQDTNGKGIQI